MATHRSLLMRANRRMGASLVDHNLVDLSELEAANERLLEVIKDGIGRRTSILSLLVTEMNVVDEAALIRRQVEEFNLAPISLAHAERDETLFRKLDSDQLWATLTVPFDMQDNFTFLASAYYLSSYVREYWEDLLGGPVLWYIATMNDLSEVIEWHAKESAHRR